MSFEVLMYNFPCNKISCFLFACLWQQRDFKLEKLVTFIFLQKLTHAIEALTEKGSLFSEKCWFVAVISLISKLKEYTNDQWPDTSTIHIF